MVMSNPRAKMSFGQSRKALLTQMTSKAKGKTQEKVIHFLNDDVPIFLKNLDNFEKKSRETRIIVK